jgi:hypothetical protein
MAQMKCPVCGSQRFYVKDPQDPYNTCEFNLVDGEIVYAADETESDPLEVVEGTETFCNRCAWHDKFKVLRQVS